MKTIINLLACTIVTLTVSSSVMKANADDLPRKEVVQLVRRKPTMYRDSKELDEWINNVREKKDINPDLLAMAKQENDWELIRFVFAALGERTDLTEEQLDELKKPLEQITSSDTPLEMLPKAYAAGVLRTLHNYPSLEHEKLLLSFLDKQDGYFNDNVSWTLAKIGTAVSLPALRKLAADLKSHSGRRGHLDVVADAIENIEKRSSWWREREIQCRNTSGRRPKYLPRHTA